MNESTAPEGPNGDNPDEAWKARHSANVVRFRLREALDHLRSNEPVEAQVALKRWADRVDLGGVPHDVRPATVEALATAIAFCRATPPDVDAATEAVERAFSLWI